MTPSQTRPRESASRKVIDQQLSNLGWNTNEQQPDCNVFTERPKSDAEARALKGRYANEGPSLHSPTPNQQTKEELVQIFGKADDLLRREGLRQGIERFSEFTNLLFLKLISEIEDDREANGQERRLASRYCWSAFASKPGEEMLD